MPPVPLHSPATGARVGPHYIHTTAGNFVDAYGRTLLLRGVNLSGASKSPVGQLSCMLDGFWDAEADGDVSGNKRLVEPSGSDDGSSLASGSSGNTHSSEFSHNPKKLSFIGRPLELDDGSADVHLARLRGWGFNMLRYPVTWEALEHAGPGKYDYEFMDYTVRLLRKCKEYGFRVYIDPHQDTWSRFSGGSGAPFWTIPACGMNPRNFTATQAAVIHCEYPSAENPNPNDLPAMIWSTNYGRLASQTLFTLFFAGRDFAPKCIIDGVNIQDYLQDHFLGAFAELAKKISEAGDLYEDCVIGWDSINEPFEGLCSWEDLNVVPSEQGSTLKKGTYPTPIQSMRLGMGQKQTVENWKFGALGPSRNGSVTIDPKGRKAWIEPSTEPGGVHPRWGWKRDPSWRLGECIWAQHGVWDVKSGYLMRPDYFQFAPTSDRAIDFVEDYWRSHWMLFSKRIREHHPEAIMFIQPPVFAPPPHINEEALKGRCAYSGHYYDGLTLITRHWNWFNADALGLIRGKYSSTLQAVRIGETAIRKSLQSQLAMLRGDARILGDYPTIIGEIGTPFDMDDKRSYGWTNNGKYKGDYSRQQKALDASLNAGDGENGLSWTIWTYTCDSSHEWGDGWNMEDLSLWNPCDLRVAQENYPGLYNSGGDGSEAGLLKKSASMEEVLGTFKEAAAGSTFSLATLGINDMNGAQATCSIPTMDIRARSGWRQNPFEFLTDGARAVRAFSRPWPWSVVGRPKDIKFDIKKGEFRLVVRVGASDRPRSPSGKEGSSDSLPTEIYVPLIHYAPDRLVKRSGSGRSVDLDLGGDAMEHAEPDSPHLVDVDVRVSQGRWSIEGQVLRWWYDCPPSGSPDQEYWIEIRRRGGPINEKALRALENENIESWVRSIFCPSEGCVVM